MAKKKVQCQTFKESYTFDYPEFVKMAETQNEVFWLAGEVKVEKDVLDVNVNMTESEQHGTQTTLKLFTLYEVKAGKEYWGGRFMRMFPRPDLQMMGNSFSFFELNVHAPFYNKLNEAMHLNTDEFYTSYVDDPVLSSRMDFIDNVISDKDDLVSLAVFSMVEGVVLYSSFAFLKHFQSKGKNKLLNVVRGVNFSVRDENLHSLGGAAAYNLLKQEMQDSGQYDDSYFEKVEERIRECAGIIKEHEFAIIGKLFEKGPMEGITETQLKHFTESRINECLKRVNMKKMYDVSYNPIAEWFYEGINAYQMNDFFTGIGNQYNRDWDEKSFIWKTTEQKELEVANVST